MTQKKPNALKSLALKRESTMVLILIVIFVVMSVARPDTFKTEDNLFNLLKQISLISIIAIGQTFVLATGGIDLSVGYSLGLAGIVMTKLFTLGINSWTAIILGLLTSVLIGFINGLIITTFNLPPFIVTLGMANVARGLTYIITKGFPIALENEFVWNLGNGYWGPVPIMAVVMIVLVIISAYLLDRTRFGTRVIAIGGNETAAMLSGINVKKYKTMVYTLTGLLAGIAGVIMVGRLNAGNPNAGLNFDTDSIAAAVVGGTSMAGGDATMVGTLLGALLLGVIKNALVLLNVNMYWQTVVVGGIIIVVCIFDSYTRAKRK